MEHVRMINFVTGTEMSVPADLVELYEKAGHKVIKDEKPAEVTPKPKRRTAKK
jgi:hypothetical protein